MRKILFSIFFIAVFTINFIDVAYAQDNTTVSVSPAIIDLRVNPGTSSTSEITIFNLGDVPMPVSLQSSSFTPVTEFNAMDFAVLDASNWISLDSSDLILHPSENRKIKLTISVPNDAEPGGHYATLYVQPRVLEQNQNFKETFVNARLGVLVFVTVLGNIDEKASLSSHQIDKYSSFGPEELSISITNEGNVHVLPKSNIKLTNMFGAVVDEIPIPPNILLPGETKNIPIPIDELFLWPGVYMADIGFLYGNSNLPSYIEKEIIYVFPISYLFALVIVLTVIFYGLILRRERLLLAIRILFGKPVNNP